MNQTSQRVVRKVHEKWTDAVHSMRRMSSKVFIQPEGPHEVFPTVRDELNGVVNIEVAPTVFYVPERANARKANLYIVVSGQLSFVVDLNDSHSIRTTDFGTRVGYFRNKENCLEHIFGVHYDMDVSSKGHPVFHSQLGSLIEYGSSIEQRYGDNKEMVDCIEKVCKGIRIPTAQMDFFSVFVQICADHLLWRDSHEKVEQEFERTREICSFFTGSGHRISFLEGKSVIECFRSVHWYEQQVSSVSP